MPISKVKGPASAAEGWFCSHPNNFLSFPTASLAPEVSGPSRAVDISPACRYPSHQRMEPERWESRSPRLCRSGGRREIRRQKLEFDIYSRSFAATTLAPAASFPAALTVNSIHQALPNVSVPKSRPQTVKPKSFSILWKLFWRCGILEVDPPGSDQQNKRVGLWVK